MAKKIRIGLRCYNPYVPNEIWDLFKGELRKIFKIAFPNVKFSISEFYWQGLSAANEYIRITPKDNNFSDWEKVWNTLNFTAREFGMEIQFVYQEHPCFKPLKEDNLFEREYANYSLINIRTWTISELDEFITNYSFEELRLKYYEI